MNPIPITWCAAGALGIAALSFGAGWQVNNWHRDSQDLSAVKKDVKHKAKQQTTVNTEADKLEEERGNVIDRPAEIRIAYRNRIVPGECGVPPDAVSVLEQARIDANARIGGEPEG